ncbi:unnamed protein product [Caenorhabditis auriculariae]|uniref:Ig-like domain-containing protein n=1 Tax=Caenorhabditis auriculariae TaxID=2777116 RepID=A0A8S1HQQ6_9PELO|nr:unnamed protein product [Caenorhabditis auriculariae]
MILVGVVNLFVVVGSAPVFQFTDDSTIHWEIEWAKAKFAEDCQNDVKFVPVYFWPGERVDLTCRMCEMAFVMNGLMKRWGYAEDISEFLVNPKRYVKINDLWKDVENSPNRRKGLLEQEQRSFGSNFLPEPSARTTENQWESGGQRLHPKYLQKDGKMTIFNADVRSQGVYFCYDDHSKTSTNVFYVVTAMIPPVKITTNFPTNYNDKCAKKSGADDKMIFASHNWRYHFLPLPSLKPPPSCSFSPDDQSCVSSSRYNYMNNASNFPVNFQKGCSMDWCRARLLPPQKDANWTLDVFLELRWDEWTSCKDGLPLKRREAHCYLVRGDGVQIPTPLSTSGWTDEFNWISHLNDVFNRPPFDVQGIRLHSSLLVSKISGRKKLEFCQVGGGGSSYELYDRVWRIVFMRTMGLKTEDGSFIESDEDGEIDQLKNPFTACLRYGKTDSVEHLIGTYMTETEYC